MRAIYMGTSEFANPALKELITRNIDILGVVTQPDRPSGRGQKLTPSPVKKVAIEYNLSVFQPEKVRKPEFVNVIRQLEPDVIIVAAFGQLLPQSILDIPPCGVINLHPSLLPKYRGAAPIQWALINGEKETGITLMLLDAGEDTGDIICAKRIPIGLEDTAEDLHHKLANIGGKLLIDILQNIPDGQPPHVTPQKHDEATHAPRLTKDIGQIDWNESALNIHNLVRGTAGWPGAYTYFRKDTLIKIIQTFPHQDAQIIKENLEQKQPGTIRITKEGNLNVVTNNGEIQLINIQPATKKVMSAKDFVNGYKIQSGECFSYM